MPLTRLYLVRHGETDWNLEGRVQGHTPTLLNETGCRQAEQLARFFAACPLSAVWSSDLPRAMETAERIAAPHDLPVRTTTALRERDLGPFEGKTGVEIRVTVDFTTWYEAPGVEQDEAMLARLLPVLEEARGLHDEVALVTHGGVQKVLLYYVLGIPAQQRRGFSLANGLVIALVPRDEGWRVEGVYAPAVMERLLGLDPHAPG